MISFATTRRNGMSECFLLMLQEQSIIKQLPAYFCIINAWVLRHTIGRSHRRGPGCPGWCLEQYGGGRSGSAPGFLSAHPEEGKKVDIHLLKFISHQLSPLSPNDEEWLDKDKPSVLKMEWPWKNLVHSRGANGIKEYHILFGWNSEKSNTWLYWHCQWRSTQKNSQCWSGEPWRYPPGYWSIQSAEEKTIQSKAANKVWVYDSMY